METTIRKLEEEFKCAICRDTYIDPKLLQCFHVYCSKCLEPLAVQDQQGQLSLTCPTCRHITPVPANGVTGLQSAFQQKRLLEILDKHKKTEDDVTHIATSKKIPNYCIEHTDKERELYCETCGELICLKCAIKGGKHQDHDYDELKEAFKKYKGEVIPLLEPVEKKSKIVQEKLSRLSSHYGEMNNQQPAIEDSIKGAFKKLHETLDDREAELLEQLHQINQSKLKSLHEVEDSVETIQAQLSSCLDFLRKSFETECHAEVLMMKTNIMKQLKELATLPFQPDIWEPNTEVDITFLASPDVITACRNYGGIYVAGDPDPSQCQATGKDLETAEVGERSTAIIQVIDYKNKTCEKPIELQCQLKSEITGVTVICKIERRVKGEYEIYYQPTIKGRHQLHIKIEGQHIRGSPFSVAVKLPIEKLDDPILTIDGMNNPRGVAVNQRGEVVVTEYREHCVSIFDSSGKRIQSFGTHGSGNGQFSLPRGVVVDSEGNILVVDSGNHRIQKFTANGKFLGAIGTKGDGPLQFLYPMDISLNSINNKVYIVDLNHRVQVLNSDLSFFCLFGNEGIGKGQFKYPQAITCDSNGKVYVAESENNRIQVFNFDGKYMRMFYRFDQDKEHELSYPVGITIDNDNRVYVSGNHNQCIFVFTPDGQFMTSFGGEGEGPGEFKCPVGLAVDNSGVVYVCDSDNNRIQYF